MADRVKYTGGATIRRITEAQWAEAGVEGQKTVEWNRRNNKSVDASELNAAALELLESEAGFRFDSDSEAANGKPKAAAPKAPLGN